MTRTFQFIGPDTNEVQVLKFLLPSACRYLEVYLSELPLKIWVKCSGHGLITQPRYLFQDNQQNKVLPFSYHQPTASDLSSTEGFSLHVMLLQLFKGPRQKNAHYLLLFIKLPIFSRFESVFEMWIVLSLWFHF